MKSVLNYIFIFVGFFCFASCASSSQKKTLRVNKKETQVLSDSTAHKLSSVKPVCCIQMPARGSKKVIK